MSQKYPEGAVIVAEVGGSNVKRKVLGCAGEVRFLSVTNDFTKYFGAWSISELEAGGWTIEEEPWVPKEGDSFFYLNENLHMCVCKEYHPFSGDLVSAGNFYRTREQAKAAAIRVKKAYRG